MAQANTYSVKLVSTFQATETLVNTAQNLNSSSSKQLGDQWDQSQTLDSGYSPAPTKQVTGELTLSSGTGTLDLTSLVGLNGVAVTATGLKLLAYRFTNKAGNANSMTIGVGASNGFTGLGATFFKGLPAPVGGSKPIGSWCAGCEGAGGVAVGSSLKTLDVAGTGSQVLRYELTFGS